MAFPNIYPDPESRRLREALAQWHGVPKEHLLVRRRRTCAHAPVPSCSLAATAAAAAVGSAGTPSCSSLPTRLTQVGCGADELIDLLMRCVLDPGDAIVDCPPTFTM